MKNFKIIINGAIISLGLITSNASAEEILTGDTRLSCEAILCLSSGVRPGECSPSLNRYFGITDPRPSKMIRKRLDFLNLCPTAHEPNMPALVSAIANGAGRCDANYLNKTNKRTVRVKVRDRHNAFGWSWVEKEVISSRKPSYCAIYENHEYTNLDSAKYIGTEAEGGFWSDKSNYDANLQNYNAQQARSKYQNNLWNR